MRVDCAKPCLPFLCLVVVGALLAAGPGAAMVRGQEKPGETASAQNSPSRQREHGGESEASRIDVCFVLDTTGSMSNLLEGAKRKIWHIANGIVDQDPTPRVRFGLVGYRDRGDAYVTKRFDLTGNIDEVYEHLEGFEADGGGDRPESVNQALHEAVTKMDWPSERSVTKIIFLVGDAPPHMDYQDDVQYPEVCKKAVKKDLIINTVRCGDHEQTGEIWREIARRAEGKFASIGQGGDMRVVETPQDEKLAALNRKLGETMVPYGSAAAREKQRMRQADSEKAEAGVAADRAAFASAKAAPDADASDRSGQDLTELLAAGEVSFEEVKTDRLPEKLREMGAKERRRHLEKQLERREKLESKIRQLQKKRRAYIEKQREKRGAEGFDAKVIEWVREQSRRSE